MRARMLLVAVVLLGSLPATAQGHAWETPQNLGPLERYHLHTDVNPSGAAVVAWGADSQVTVQRSAPGGAFGARVVVATGDVDVYDVAITGDGDVLLLLNRTHRYELMTLPAGGGPSQTQDIGPPVSLTSPELVTAGADEAALAVVTADALGAHVLRRGADGTFSTVGTLGPDAEAWEMRVAMLGERTLVAWNESPHNSYGKVRARVIGGDGTMEPIQELGPYSAESLVLTDRPGGGIVLTWVRWTPDNTIYSAVAGPTGVFAAPEPVSEAPFEMSVHEARVAARPGGGAMIGAGDGYFVSLRMWTVSPLGQVAKLPVPNVGNRALEFRVGVTSDGTPLAAWFSQSDPSSGEYPVQVSARLGGTWCRPETLGVQTGPGWPALHTDERGGALLIWPSRDGIYASRYHARADCPPPPPSPAAEPTQDAVQTPTPQPAVARRSRILVEIPNSATVDRRGRLRLRVRCTAAGPCAGRLRLLRSKALYAGRTFRLKGARGTLTVKLNARGRRAVRRARRGTRVAAEGRVAREPARKTPLLLRRKR